MAESGDMGGLKDMMHFTNGWHLFNVQVLYIFVYCGVHLGTLSPLEV